MYVALIAHLIGAEYRKSAKQLWGSPMPVILIKTTNANLDIQAKEKLPQFYKLLQKLNPHYAITYSKKQELIIPKLAYPSIGHVSLDLIAKEAAIDNCALVPNDYLLQVAYLTLYTLYMDPTNIENWLESLYNPDSPNKPIVETILGPKEQFLKDVQTFYRQIYDRCKEEGFKTWECKAIQTASQDPDIEEK